MCLSPFFNRLLCAGPDAIGRVWRSFFSLRDPAALNGTAGPPDWLSLGGSPTLNKRMHAG